MNEEYESGGGMLPPGKLLHSFVVVAGAYILFMVFIFGTFIASARFFFPDVFTHMMESDPETIKGLMETEPEAIFPRPMYWSWLVVNSLLCIALGWTIARMAPFGKFAHSVFLAVLIAVGCLQQAIASPSSFAWMFVLVMGAFPIATLFGSHLALSGAVSQKSEP